MMMLSTCQALVITFGLTESDGDEQSGNPLRLDVQRFSALRRPASSGFNPSCRVCAADQYQLYQKWRRAKPKCIVSTCTHTDGSLWKYWRYCCLFISGQRHVDGNGIHLRTAPLIMCVNSKLRIIVLSFDRRVDLSLAGRFEFHTWEESGGGI